MPTTTQAHKTKSLFDFKNPKHRLILSLLHQANWTIDKGEKHLADVNRLNHFLTNNSRSPVKKKIIDMNGIELEKVITAFQNIVDFENK